ncbi:MAG: group III truncated hemoglobin [Flavobacteriaceae bacterium]|nr:group III truncated hemoglobin [Flavobacteriaceae bacterium]
MTYPILKDIENRADIEFLIDEFYKKIITDDLIGHFFTKVIVISWEKHIPIMYDFWETTLLGKMKYKGNPMVKHLELSKKQQITTQHFDQWLYYWEKTINKNFKGQIANDAIKRAKQIGELMKFKLQQHQ